MAFGVTVSGASADEACGIGRVAIEIDGTVQITP